MIWPHRHGHSRKVELQVDKGDPAPVGWAFRWDMDSLVITKPAASDTQFGGRVQCDNLPLWSPRLHT
jgi:hypothetical protein